MRERLLAKTYVMREQSATDFLADKDDASATALANIIDKLYDLYAELGEYLDAQTEILKAAREMRPEYDPELKIHGTSPEDFVIPGTTDEELDDCYEAYNEAEETSYDFEYRIDRAEDIEDAIKQALDLTS